MKCLLLGGLLLVLGACKDPAGGEVEVQPLEGGEIYRLHCQVCHGTEGEGIPGTCPPFEGSPRLAGQHRAELLKIMLLGRSGEVERAGQQYRGLMPAWRYELSDSQIAAVLNYIQSKPWGGGAGNSFDAEEVSAVRRATAGERHFPE